MSPALGNDCDADRYVKKPMLHDMFDLLGLPLYNTGLSLYHLLLDDNCQNIEPNGSVKGDCSATTLNIAGRWSRKQKKALSKSHVRSSSASVNRVNLSK